MPTPLWSYRLTTPPAGIAFARESGQTLVWDQNSRLVLLSRRGSLQIQTQHFAGLTGAAIADDGSAFALVDDHSVTWLRRDLTPRWQKTFTQKPLVVALDPHGRCLAVADAANQLNLFDKGGRVICPALNTPRPLYHLRFVPADPFLLAAADFGLLLALDLRSRQWAWQDAPVIHLGSLDAAGDGSTIVVACFSEGIRRYNLAGKPRNSLLTSEPCRFVAVTYGGQRVLAGGIFGQLCAFDDLGGQRFEQRFEPALVGVNLSPLGDSAVLALADGRVLGLDLSAELK